MAKGKFDIRLCLICGKKFYVRPYDPTMTCGRKCGAVWREELIKKWSKSYA